jgi:hypothetical protein
MKLKISPNFNLSLARAKAAAGASNNTEAITPKVITRLFKE